MAGTFCAYPASSPQQLLPGDFNVAINSTATVDVWAVGHKQLYFSPRPPWV